MTLSRDPDTLAGPDEPEGFKYDPEFAFLTRQSQQEMRAKLEAEAREMINPAAPEWFKRDVSRAYVEIAGWGTPACPPTPFLRRI